MMHKLNAKGFTLIEMLIAIGVIILLIIGVYFTYSKVNEARLPTIEAKEMRAILASASSLVAGNNTVAVFDAPLLARAKIIHDSKVVGTNYLSETGQLVQFDALYTNGFSHFRVTYLDSNINYCVKLVHAYAPDVDLINVNGTILKNHMPDYIRIDYKIEEAAAACGSAGESFPMSFNFRR